MRVAAAHTICDVANNMHVCRQANESQLGIVVYLICYILYIYNDVYVTMNIIDHMY